MFLSYHQQFEMANEHRRELEARAAKERLYRLIEKPATHRWSLATLFQPWMTKAKKGESERAPMIPVLAKVSSTKL